MLCEVDEVPNMEGKPVLVLPKTLKEEEGVLVVVLVEVVVAVL